MNIGLKSINSHCQLKTLLYFQKKKILKIETIIHKKYHVDLPFRQKKHEIHVVSFFKLYCFEVLDIFNTLISWQHGELAIYILL